MQRSKYANVQTEMQMLVDLNHFTAFTVTSKFGKNCSLNFADLHIGKFANFIIVEDIGVEPMTLCVQGRCSSQLS